jgi:hypothetical protein
MKKFVPFLVGFVVAVVPVTLALAPWERLVRQPIAFNHRVHVEEVGLSCTGCHEFAEEREMASVPNQDTCLNCHDVETAESPEVGKIRQYVQTNKPIPWKRIHLLPTHVFFSHRRHVTLGKVECTTCHGEMGKRQRPPKKPMVRLAMEDCMACHQQQQVNNDCLTCHR